MIKDNSLGRSLLLALALVVLLVAAGSAEQTKQAPRASKAPKSLSKEAPPAVLPSLDGATEWLNSPSLTAAGLRGKVVLIDFWTYSCINWIRSLSNVGNFTQ